LLLVHPTQNVTTKIFLRKIFLLINFTNGKDGPSSNAHSRHIFIMLRFFFTFLPARLHFAAARSDGNIIIFFFFFLSFSSFAISYSDVAGRKMTKIPRTNFYDTPRPTHFLRPRPLETPAEIWARTLLYLLRRNVVLKLS
jgi:hypothetical protein